MSAEDLLQLEERKATPVSRPTSRRSSTRSRPRSATPRSRPSRTRSARGSRPSAQAKARAGLRRRRCARRRTSVVALEPPRIEGRGRRGRASGRRTRRSRSSSSATTSAPSASAREPDGEARSLKKYPEQVRFVYRALPARQHAPEGAPRGRGGRLRRGAGQVLGVPRPRVRSRPSRSRGDAPQARREGEASTSRRSTPASRSSRHRAQDRRRRRRRPRGRRLRHAGLLRERHPALGRPLREGVREADRAELEAKPPAAEGPAASRPPAAPRLPSARPGGRARRAMRAGSRASRFRRSTGSVFDGRRLNHQSGYSTSSPSRCETRAAAVLGLDGARAAPAESATRRLISPLAA